MNINTAIIPYTTPITAEEFIKTVLQKTRKDEINNSNLPEEILLKICKELEPSDLLKLRLVTKQFDRICSDIELYKGSADQVPNLNTLENRNVTEQARSFFSRYYEIMGKNLGLSNETLALPNSNKIIDDLCTNTNMLTNKLYEYIRYDESLDAETVSMFFRSGVKADIEILNHCFRESNFNEKPVSVELVKLIINKLETPLAKKQLIDLFLYAVSCKTNKIEVFKFLLEELKCPIPPMINTSHFNPEIQEYILDTQIAQLLTIRTLHVANCHRLTTIVSAPFIGGPY